MTTLAEINQTLQQQLSLMAEQGKSIERTSNSIESVKKTIASVLLQQKSDRLQAVEDKRELQKKEKTSDMPSGFLAGLGKGTGVSWFGDLIGGVFGSLLGKGGSLLGMLTGAIGLAAGKLLVWTAIGTLIANFFGDEIKAFVEKFKEWTGIDIIAELEKTGYKEEILFAATTAIGALTLGFTKLIAKLSARAVLALGTAGLGMLGFGSKTPPTANPTAKAQQPTQPAKAQQPTQPAKAQQPTQPAKAQQPTAKSPVRPGQATSGQLPKGFSLNKAGKVIRSGTGQFATTDEVVKAIELAGKGTKYLKLLKFLGAAGTVTESLIDPALAIYNDAPESEVRKQLVGSLGSIGGAALGGALGVAGVTAIPGVGQTGIANILGGVAGAVVGSLSGEWLVEELADFLMGTNVNTKPLPGMEGGAPNRMTANRMAREAAKETATASAASIPRTAEELNAAANEFAGYEPLAIPLSTPNLSVPSIVAVPSASNVASPVNVSRGDNPYVRMASGLIDPVTLQGRINAFDQYGVDRDRLRTSPAERGIYPSVTQTGAAMTQAAANAKISAIINNTPVINNITNNNGGGGATSIMTVPVATADTSDRRDIIRRYGR
jgi:hypothetical protein